MDVVDQMIEVQAKATSKSNSITSFEKYYNIIDV